MLVSLNSVKKVKRIMKIALMWDHIETKMELLQMKRRSRSLRGSLNLYFSQIVVLLIMTINDELSLMHNNYQKTRISNDRNKSMSRQRNGMAE